MRANRSAHTCLTLALVASLAGSWVGSASADSVIPKETDVHRARATPVHRFPDSGITRDEGQIAILEHDGSNYDHSTSDGSLNLEARTAVANRFYEAHGDHYDYLVVFTNFPYDNAGAIAWNFLVRNAVQGTGTPIGDNGPLFGSPGRLGAFIDMGPIAQYRSVPFSLEPGQPGFERTLGVLAHEVGHNWLARVRYLRGGNPSTALLGQLSSHWSYLLDSDASFLYGSDWTAQAGSGYLASRVLEQYSSLDLYLMGMLEPAQVPAFTLLVNPAVDPTGLPVEGATVEAQLELVEVGQITAVEGSRLPDHLHSQKVFRLGFVVLSAPGVDPSVDDLAAVDRVREAFESRFFAWTRAVAVASTDLVEAPEPPAAPAPDLDKALTWLLLQQSMDGSWSDAPGTAPRDTAAAVEALREAGHQDAPYLGGVAWLRQIQPSNLDYLARRGLGIADSTTASERQLMLAQILSHQNLDGGFGAGPGYASDALDTGLALRALKALGYPLNARVLQALGALAAQEVRDSSGGFRGVRGGEVSNVVTAQVVLALHDWLDAGAAQALLGPAMGALLVRQNPDGGFGESPSTPYATALALEALLVSAVSGQAVEGAVSWLESHQLVDGSWDRRRFDTALVLHALKGGTRPNLTVSPDDLTLTPPAAEEGDVVAVAARVRNVGHVASEASRVRLYDGPPGAGTVVDETPLPALDPDSESEVSLSFDTTGRVGDRTLYVVADPDGEIAEVREDDNTALRALHVEGPLPDLAIPPADLQVPPYPVEQGEVLAFGVTVRNSGERPADSSRLQVVDIDPQGQTRLVADANVPALPAGGSFTMSASWDTTDAGIGNHTLRALADADFAIQESSEENNLVHAPVHVTGPLPPGPDLNVASVTAEPATLMTIPQDVQLHVLVHNLGRDPGAAVVALHLEDTTGPLLAEQPVDLQPHTSATLTFPLVLDTPGSRTFVAVADPEGTLVETDETNNVGAVLFEDPGNVLDVEILPGDVTPSSTELVVGERLDVTAVVRNRGTRAFEEIPVILGHVEGDTTAELYRAYVSLEPGNSTTIVLSWVTSIVGDPVMLVVRADPFDLLAEVNEANNDVPLAIQVSPSTLPNLRLGGADVSLSPDPPLEGGDANVSAIVRNPGAVAAGPFEVSFYLGHPEAGGVLIGGTALPGVEAGGDVVASILWSPVDVHGAQGVFVVADSAGAVDEYDETDNQAFKPFSVIGLPDLVLASGDVVLDPPYPRSGEAVTIHGVVRNLGQQPAVASTLRVVEGEGATAAVVGEAPMPALGVGENAEVSLEWTPASPPGVRLLSLSSDAGGAVVEQDEANNVAELSVVVQDADLYLTEPYFSPNGDGLKDATTLAFRADPTRVVLSDDRGQPVRTFEGGMLGSGTVDWDGVDERGVLVPDGVYEFSLEGGGGVLGRAQVVVDTDRSAIHDTAGTPLKAVRNLTCAEPAVQGPVFMPAEDEVLLIVPSPSSMALPPGLVRVALDGTSSLISSDSFFDQAFFSGGVAPDGREVLVSTYDGGLYAVDLASGERRLLTSGGWDGGGAWSPDGRWIVTRTQVLEREGSLVTELPEPQDGGSSGVSWQWSPDGEWLASGRVVLRRDGQEQRELALPEEVQPIEDEECGHLTFRETLWLPNGMLQFSAEAYSRFGVEGCTVVRTWHLEASPGAESATIYDGPWGSWSPDGKKVLYYVYDEANPARTVVARADGSLLLQLLPFYAIPSPRSSAVWYQRPPAPGSACDGLGSDLVAVTSLQNLTVDLAPAILPSNGGVLVRGTVSDRNLDRYQLEWAAPSEPDTWHPIGPASSIPVLDDVVGVWVPPGPGTFVLRLRATDRAGNARERAASIWWDHVASITNISQDELMISPTNDGIQDTLTVSFLVVEPTRADVVIRGPVTPGVPPEAAPIVRSMSIDLPAVGPQSVAWDGRDDQGQVALDGRYTVLFNDLPLRVDVDASPPDVAWRYENLRIEERHVVVPECSSAFPAPPRIAQQGMVLSDRLAHVVDAHLDQYWITRDPQGPVPVAGTSREPVYEPLRDASGNIVYDANGVPVVLLEGGHPVDRRDESAPLADTGFSLVARDQAGNRSIIPLDPLGERLFFLEARPRGCDSLTGDQLMAPFTGPGDPELNQTRAFGPTTDLVVGETLHTPPQESEETRFQYRRLGDPAWSDAPSFDVLPTRQFHQLWAADFEALGIPAANEYRGRFSARDGSALSEEFQFRPCDAFASLSLAAHDIPGSSMMEVTLNVSATLPGPIQSAFVNVTGSGSLHNFHMTVPLDSSLTASAIVPQPDCDDRLSFDARLMTADHSYGGDDGACLSLSKELPRAGVAVSQRFPKCEMAAPDRVVLAVSWTTPESGSLRLETGPPDAPVLIEEFAVSGSGSRAVTWDVGDLLEGVAPVRALLLGGAGLLCPGGAEAQVRIDRTPPVAEVLDPPEAGVLCSSPEGNGAEMATVVARVTDAQPEAEFVGAELRQGEGPWQPLDVECVECHGRFGDDAQIVPTGPPLHFKWDIAALPSGDYAVRLEFCDLLGNRTTVERSFQLRHDPPYIGVAAVQPPFFSPNGDGQLDSVAATFTTYQTLFLTVQVHRSASDGLVVRTLADAQQLGPGDHTFFWDGRDASGQVQPDDTYFIVTSGESPCGGDAIASTPAVIDLMQPIAVVSAPPAGATLISSVDIYGTASDDHFAGYDLSYGAGSNPSAWTPIGSGSGAVIGGLLGHWDIPNAEGPHTLRLVTRDLAGNAEQALVPVNLGPAAAIRRLSATPALFSPNGDGRRETTTIEYELAMAGLVTLQVRGPGDVVLRSFENGAPHPPDELQSIVWDGTKDDGTAAPDGDLSVWLRVEDEVGGAQEQAIALILDRAPPAIQITSPTEGSFHSRDESVHGSIQDTHITSWSVSAGPPGTPPVQLGHGNQERVDADLASMAPLADGPQVLVVEADDAAENRAVTSLGFTVDSLPPVVHLIAPADAAILPRENGPIPITGSVSDLNLSGWTVGFGYGTSPATFQEIGQGTTGGSGLALASWNVASLPEGVFTLRLVAQDKAQLSAETRVTVTLDGTPPVAVIASPVEGAFLAGEVPITGTASDENLESWELHAAPGTAESAFQWSLLAAGTANVSGAAFSNWAPLPPDGANTLRLRVRDRAGHVSTVFRTVTVDTLPPGAPSGLSAEVTPNGATTADVALQWIPSSSDDVLGYLVARDGTILTADPVPTNSFTDFGRSEGTYEYAVRAVDGAGNTSVAASVSVRVDLTPPLCDILRPTPGAPVTGTVDVRGTAFSPDDFREYRLLVGAGASPSSWTLIRESTLPVAAGLLGTWAAVGDGPYTLALEAEDTSGNVARTTVTVVVDNVPPLPPTLTSLTGLPGEPDGLVATWAASPSSDVDGYLVYRDGRLANASSVVLGDLRPYLVPGPSYTDHALPDGERCYGIVAMDHAGNLSPVSNTLCVTLDNRRPHAIIVQPESGLRFDYPVHVVAVVPDTDVAVLRFELKPHAVPDWGPLGSPDSVPPFEVVLDPAGLPFGDYDLRAVAEDAGGPDPAPVGITVTYGDATAPHAPTSLQARVDGHEVALTWVSDTAPDLAGHLVERDGQRLTPSPVPGANFTDPDADLGTHIYGVIAVDQDGNESSPATIDARVFALTLDAPAYPVTSEATAALTGSGTTAGATVEILSGSTVVGQSTATGTTFELVVPLVSGTNLLAARETDAEGDRSVPSEEVVLIVNQPPAPVSGLAAAVDGHDVTLAWDPHPEPDVFGLRVLRDGGLLLGSSPETTATSTYASSTLDPFVPERAFDGSPATLWRPVTLPATWTVELGEAVLVERVALAFASWPGIPIVVPRYRVEAGWEGRFVPLVEVLDGTTTHVEHALPAPFATDRLRVTIDGPGEIGIAEVGIWRLDVVPAAAPAYTDPGAPDGVHVYGIVAIDRYGARSAPAEVTAPVGDVEPPASPTGLTASVSGRDVTIQWNPNGEPDLSHYVLLRDGDPIAETPVTSHVDTALPNGTYVYTVRAVDLVGNASPESEPAYATVAEVAPDAPVLEGTATPEGLVSLTWSHAGATSFAVLRSPMPGGPHDLIAITADVRAFLDTTAPLSVTAYYVVRARDDQGAESEDSNEVAVTPMRTGPPKAPAILSPSDAAHPLTVYEPRADVLGLADLGAIVLLDVNGHLSAAALPTAWTGLAETTSLAVPASAPTLALSADGRVVAHEVGDAIRVVDVATGAGLDVTHPGRDRVMAPALSGEGKRLGYAGLTLDEGGQVIGGGLYALDLETGVVATLDETPGDAPGESAWSPEGRRLAFVTSGPAGTELRVRDLPAGATTVLGSWPDRRPLHLRWSPDGRRIACVLQAADSTSGELLLVDTATGAPLSLDMLALADSAPAWSLDARKLAFSAVGAGAPRILVRDLESGADTEVTDGLYAATEPRIDHAMNRVTYALAFPAEGWRALFAQRLDSGETQAVIGPAVGTRFAFHGWTEDGRLAVARDGRLGFFSDYDGVFEMPGVPLSVGENQLVARSADVATGLVGPDSQPVQLTLPAEAVADLGVSPQDLASYPAIPLAGQATVLSASIHNLGGVETGAVPVRLAVADASGTPVFEIEDSLEGLPPGETAIVSAYWTPAVAGDYVLGATVDPFDVLPEVDETNNEAARTLVVASQAGLLVQVVADEQEYPANTPALVDLTLTNAGPDFQGTATTTVRASDGAIVAAVDSRPVQLAYGTSLAYAATWNTGATYAGGYSFRLEVVPGAGDIPVAQAEAPFQILPDIQVSARVVPMHVLVAEGSAAEFAAEVDNDGANTPLDGLLARLSVSPAAGGQPLFESEIALPQLLPGASWEGQLAWSPASPVGAYVARLEVLNAGALAAVAQAAFEVVPSGQDITGTVSLDPDEILTGETTEAHLVLANGAAVPAPGIEVAVEIVAAGDTTVLVQETITLDLPAHGSAQADLALATASLPGGTYLAFLRLLPSGTSLDVRTLKVHAPLTAPSLDEPPVGGQVTTPHPTLSVNNGAGGPGAILTYAFELYRDAALSQLDASISGVTEGPERTAWTVSQALDENQAYYWRARATDGFSSSPWTSVGSFVVDAENPPPSAPVPDTPFPGADVATLQPILSVRNSHDSDAQPLTYDFRLATDEGMTQILSSAGGLPEGPGLTSWAQPLVLVENARYYWSARASDGAAYSPWSEAVWFVVNTEDETPSVPTLLRPIGGEDVATLSPEMAVSGSQDPEGAPVSYLFQVDRLPSFDSPELQVSPTIEEGPLETLWTAPSPLADNTLYYWRAAAGDGHTTSAWAGSHFFVNLFNEPPGTPTPQDPADGGVVTTVTPTLRVQNTTDPDHDVLTYGFRVTDEVGVEVASTSGVPEGLGETAWTVDVPLTENAVFFWSARASDGALVGDPSSFISFRVNATAEPPTAPTLVSPAEGSVLEAPQPTLVVSNATSPDGASLTYTFELYRVESGGGLVLVEAASGIPEGSGTTEWTPSQELANADYSWRCQAEDALQQAGPWMTSAHFTVNVDMPPNPPPSLEVASMRLQVFLSWAPSPDPDVTSYRVYRATTSGGPYAWVGTTGDTAFEDLAPEYLLTLYYVVTALDAAHESAYSPEVAVTPRPCLSGSAVELCPHPAPTIGRSPR